MPKRRLADLPSADVIKYQLTLAGLSANAAARKLGINNRTMYRYVNGERVVPLAIDWAMRGLIAHRDEWLKPSDRSTQARSKLGRWVPGMAV